MPRGDVPRRWVVWRGVPWLPVVRWALLLALPLVVVGLVAAQLLDADYVVGRQQAYAEAEANAGRIEAAAGAAVTGLADAFVRRVEADLSNGDPDAALRSLVYANEVTAVLVRRDGRRLFPPDGGWDLTADLRSSLNALEAAADARVGEVATDGWFAGTGGATFFQCRIVAGTTEICVALDWAHVAASLRAALDSAASTIPGWSFRVRDPFDRFVWSRGGLQLPTGDVFVSSGAMRGWRIAAAGAGAPPQGARTRIALAAPIAAGWLALVWAMVRRQRDRVAETFARGEWTAKLSHDLRTPLANLKLYAELIERRTEIGAAGDDKVADYCRVLREEIDRLDALAGTTITLGTSPQAVRLDVGVPDDIVRKAVARLGRLLDASGCRCDVEAGAGRPCRFDRAAFERILDNLIDNARKYAPGTIRVTTVLDGERLRLSVRDWGAGFAIRPRRGEGFGLGLSVVRDLAKANGGDVAVVDCRPGSRVEVTLKAAAAEGD